MPDLDLLDINTILKLGHGEYILKMGEIATAVENHTHFKDYKFPEEVPDSGRIRGGAEKLSQAVAAARNKDKLKEKERDEIRKECNLNLKVFGQWVTILAVVKKDPGYIANLGIEEKKQYTRSAVPSEIEATERFSVVHVNGKSGSVLCKAKKVKGSSSCELQICQTDPRDDTAWSTVDHFAHCNQMVVPGLTPGQVYYFRCRFLGPLGHGAWSTVASIRVL